MRRKVLFCLVAISVAASIATAEDTYTLKSGRMVRLSNELPPSISKFSSISDLTAVLSERMTAFFDGDPEAFESFQSDIRVRVYIADNVLYGGIYIANYDRSKTQIKIGRMSGDGISLLYPYNFMVFVWAWISQGISQMPNDLASSLRESYSIGTFINLTKRNGDYLLIQATPKRSTLENYLSIDPPLVCQISGNVSYVVPTNLHELSIIPLIRLGPTKDLISGKFLAPFSIYKFLDLEPSTSR